MNKIKILHTADWHLGARLAGQTRDAEHRAFLDWLLELLASEQADILIIAGDIFDSATPPVAAQEMYYRFLHAASARCRHIVIIGGNHDSAAFLDAPRTLLAALSAHVLGATPELRDSEHYFFDLPAFSAFLQNWLQSANLQDAMRNKIGEWFEAGLQPWDISV